MSTKQERTSVPDPDDDIQLVTWLSPDDFDALVERLDRPAVFDPRVAEVLLRQAPWDQDASNPVDKEMDQP